MLAFSLVSFFSRILASELVVNARRSSIAYGERAWFAHGTLKSQANKNTSAILHGLTELDEAYSVGSRLAIIVEESANEIYTLTRALVFTSAKRAAVRNLGYSDDEFLQMTSVSRHSTV